MITPLESDAHFEPERPTYLRESLETRIFIGVFEFRNLLLADTRELAERLLGKAGIATCPSDAESCREAGPNRHASNFLVGGRACDLDRTRRHLPVNEVRFEPALERLARGVRDFIAGISERLAARAGGELGQEVLSLAGDERALVHGQPSGELNARLLLDAFESADRDVFLRMRNRDDAGAAVML